MSDPSGGAYYKTYPRNCAADDYWGQVGRTVKGIAVPQQQIDLIVDNVSCSLDLSADDTLLDLCCGNGALTAYFFSRCRGGVGVDFSEFLIDVANRKFRARPDERYVCADALDYLGTEPQPDMFTKVLCYGAFQYFPTETGRRLLDALRTKFGHVARLHLGNLPDKTRLEDFYKDREYVPGIENSAETPIGIWWSPDELARLAAACGWSCRILRMPEQFYASHYRFDALLTPA